MEKFVAFLEDPDERKADKKKKKINDLLNVIL